MQNTNRVLSKPMIGTDTVQQRIISKSIEIYMVVYVPIHMMAKTIHQMHKWNCIIQMRQIHTDHI